MHLMFVLVYMHLMHIGVWSGFMTPISNFSWTYPDLAEQQQQSSHYYRHAEFDHSPLSSWPTEFMPSTWAMDDTDTEVSQKLWQHWVASDAEAYSLPWVFAHTTWFLLMVPYRLWLSYTFAMFYVFIPYGLPGGTHLSPQQLCASLASAMTTEIFWRAHPYNIDQCYLMIFYRFNGTMAFLISIFLILTTAYMVWRYICCCCQRSSPLPPWWGRCFRRSDIITAKKKEQTARKLAATTQK